MESCDFICAMLQPALPSSCVSRRPLRSASHGARHDLFSFPLLLPNHPSQSQVAPSGFSSLRHLSAPSENPRRFSVVIPFKSSYRNPFRGVLRVAGSSRLQRSSEPFSRRAFHPVAVLACREIYHTTPFCQFFSRCFFIFSRSLFRPYPLQPPLIHT